MIDTTDEERLIANSLRETGRGSDEFPSAYVRYQDFVEKEKRDIETSGGKTTVYILKSTDRKSRAPVHIYLHGGGFVIGHGERDLYFCSRLASQTRGIVVDIDYKLAPEYKYPVAFNESYDVTKWVFDNIDQLGGDPDAVTINGYSAGANLATAVALKAIETRDFQLRMLLMNYAIIDLVTDPGEKGAGEGSVLAERGRLFNRLYTGDDREIMKSPYVSMRFAQDGALARLPETVIVTAGRDSLRFECEVFAKRLIELGVKITAKRFLDSNHGFVINCANQWDEAQKMTIGILDKL
ncbi:MAG: hypothetical protein A2Z99_21245 [Treponema sp. GWB1_62_6]|nr:MAG: hypothetical protein A2Y36_01770 [Treponema sp. GWA1_62_8]OHE68372.1 MAG: hypothetical protein A2001_06230 [Treponema sp. GWC1_61_84]OHE71262.1 MAG: hypothetical protein A2413_19585 [Treponema sp. RIFOXYC1_FULL_61_9]OHE71720.1 MAG: hypothetical protein A2Z99_21245 [Treponema sp. GWB1_62_6]HCM28774.1 hypothetical protein [Treponema sp.]